MGVDVAEIAGFIALTEGTFIAGRGIGAGVGIGTGVGFGVGAGMADEIPVAIFADADGVGIATGVDIGFGAVTSGIFFAVDHPLSESGCGVAGAGVEGAGGVKGLLVTGVGTTGVCIDRAFTKITGVFIIIGFATVGSNLSKSDTSIP